MVLFGSQTRIRERCGARFPLVPMGVFDGAWYASRSPQCDGHTVLTLSVSIRRQRTTLMRRSGYLKVSKWVLSDQGPELWGCGLA